MAAGGAVGRGEVTGRGPWRAGRTSFTVRWTRPRLALIPPLAHLKWTHRYMYYIYMYVYFIYKYIYICILYICYTHTRSS